MQIDTSGYSSYPVGGVSQASADKGAISRQDFLNLLVAELTHQDPFEPMSTSDMMNQMVMLEDMQSQEKLADSLDMLLHESRVGSASSLMGRTVRGIGSGDNVVEGIVTGVAITGDTIECILNGNRATSIELGNVTDVKLTL